MKKYIESLSGITYLEWVKLRAGVDRVFEYQKSESERQLKLADISKVDEVIRSQFG